MKIGLVVEHFDPHRGGLEQWSWQFAQALVSQGHEVHVISRSFSPETAALDIRRHPIPGPGNRVGFAQAAEALVGQSEWDIIHDTGAGWYCDIFQPHWGSWLALAEQKLLLLPRWLRPWKRMFIRILPRYRDIRRLMDRQYQRDGRFFLALSARAARDFRTFHSVPPEDIRIVHNGVDIRRFCPENGQRYRTEIRRQWGVEEETLVVLIVAHNFRLKGVPTLTEAVRRLAARGVRIHLLVVGGKRPYLAKGGKSFRSGPDPVSWVGPVKDTAPYYAAADLYVHPTLYDTFSLVLLEAMASGLPVITSRFNGVQELLHPGVEGYILKDPLDAEEIAQKILLFEEPEIRRKMGQAARRLAEQHPFEKNVDQILSVYEEVLRKKLRGQPPTGQGRCVGPFICRRTLPTAMEEKDFSPFLIFQGSRDGYRTCD